MGLFTEDSHSSFSDLWFRVGPTRPRLSPHAQVVRQSFGDQTVYVVEDPAASNFYRLTEPAYFFLGLLDGRRSINEAWEACNAQLGDASPTQRECIDLLAKMQRFGLLLGDLPLAPDMVKLRRDETEKTRRRRTRGRLFSLTLPIVNPEPVLERVAPVLRAVFSRWGLALWAAIILAALWNVAPRWRELFSDLNGILDPSNLLWLSAMFLGIRAWHELGHAMVCKAMGGRCTQIGVLLILLVIPLPYCDATSSWRFPEVWKRVVVSAGGMLVELFAAGIAAIVWSYAEPGLLRTLCYNMMVVSGVATLVFNANPLLRYDGYYILSDLTGTPNLAQRSRDVWRFLIERVAFGVKSLRPPAVRGTGEAWFLAVYAALSWPYRLFITVSLLVFVSGQYATLGLVMAVVAASAWLLWPMLKSAAYLAAEPRLMGRRGRAAAVSLGALAGLALVIGVIPFPAAGYGNGTIEPADRAVIRPQEEGFIAEWLARPGETITPGQPLLRLSNVEIDSELAIARARAAQAQAALDDATTKSPTDREVAERVLAKSRSDLDRARARHDALTVRSPIAGTLTSAGGVDSELESLVGRFVQRGAPIARVQSLDRLTVRALVSDLDQAYVFGGATTANPPIMDARAAEHVNATVRVRGLTFKPFTAAITRVGPAGTRTLSAESLATVVGGAVEMDPTDPKRQRTVHPQFLIELDAVDPPPELRPGQRARVRLGVAPAPLIQQAWRRTQQFFTLRRSS